jgi:adenosine deaminase
MQHLTDIQTDPKALYAFFKAMPKGGELHYHLAGGASAEAMIKLAATHHYCINLTTYAVSPNPSPCQGTPAEEILRDPIQYQAVLSAWTMKGFKVGKESAHDHFFAAFYKFMPIVEHFGPALLADVMKRAASQHELYLEIMILPDNVKSASFAKPLGDITSLSNIKKTLLANRQFQSNICHTVTQSKQLLEDARQKLGCGKHRVGNSACFLTIKFQYYILREQPLPQFFAQALNGFEAASLSKDIVGINLVQAEDGPIALRDYRAQMRILDFLYKAYPNVNIALHAGELTKNLAPVKDLHFHITAAIAEGHATRIGHGVDLAEEKNMEHLLKQMSKNDIAVEVNLTSNKTILRIEGPSHPINIYQPSQVPIVLSTDDEGILRTNLTKEFVTAFTTYHLDYPTLKNINRNTLTYSFLPGKSIWSSPKQAILVKECSDLNSKSCLRFIKENPKGKLQRNLEKALHRFEKQY